MRGRAIARRAPVDPEEGQSSGFDQQARLALRTGQARS